MKAVEVLSLVGGHVDEELLKRNESRSPKTLSVAKTLAFMRARIGRLGLERLDYIRLIGKSVVGFSFRQLTMTVGRAPH